MALMSVLVVIFMSGIVQMTKDVVRVQNASNSADQARRAFDRFERQTRVASDLNRPVLVAGARWYLEFRTTVTGTGTPGCTQWRLDTTTDLLQQRTWDDVSSPAVPAWQTVAAKVTNSPGTQQPFTVSPADSVYTQQRVALFLAVSSGQPGGVQVSGVVSARNTSLATVTNADANSDGVSDTQVCQQAGRP